MITSIKIDNFKSLVAFDLPLTKFNCLIGLNGSGKSTVLQAIDFLSQLMIGDLEEWLELRHWRSADLNSKLTNKSNIDFEVVISDPAWGEILWSGSINRTKLQCTREVVRLVGFFNTKILIVDAGNCSIFPLCGIQELSAFKNLEEAGRPDKFPIIFEYTGSVISQLKKEQITLPLQALKDHLVGVKSLDLISPAAMKNRSRSSGQDMGLGGENLSAFLHDLDPSKLESLLRMLRQMYPNLEGIKISHLGSGRKQLSIKEKFGERFLNTEARHINDGMLRLIAILAEIVTDDQFLLFDEIENGINPELVEFLLNALVKARQQILVTTHSPMILNYLDDDVARAGVQYLYKTPEGFTRSVPFFDIPSLGEKLEVMGPGEAFVDTDLTRLYDEIQTMPSRDREKDDADSR